jgi:hypothetical protein
VFRRLALSSSFTTNSPVTSFCKGGIGDEVDLPINFLARLQYDLGFDCPNLKIHRLNASEAKDNLRPFNMKKIYHYIFYINFFYLTKQFSARHFNEQLLTFYVHIMPFREEQNLARCEKT